MFTWIPFFEELSTKLRFYKNRQAELVQMLQQAGVEKGLMDRKIQNGKEFLLEEIDPFTFFASFNKYKSIERRSGILATLKSMLQIHAEVPTDFDGVPTSQPQGFWFFGYKYRRPDSQIPMLWDLFESVLDGTVTPDQLKLSIQLHGVGVSIITQSMFRMRPSIYFPFDRKTKKSIRNKYPDIPLDSFPENYFEFLANSQKELTSDPLYFARLSMDGRYLSQNSTGMKISSLTGSYLDNMISLRGLFSTVEEATPHFEFMRHCLDLCGIQDANNPVVALTFRKSGRKVILRLVIYNASLYLVEGFNGRITKTRITASDDAKKVIPNLEGDNFRYGGRVRVSEYTLKGYDVDMIQRLGIAIDHGVHALGEVYSKYQTSPLRRFHNQEMLDACFDTSLIAQLLSKEFVAVEEEEQNELIQTARHQLNTILYGPPGTGKTFATREAALRFIDGTCSQNLAQQQQRYIELIESGQIRFVTFHQSYSYEEFVEGIRPQLTASGAISYDVMPGVLSQIAEAAVGSVDNYVLIIDEINRGNISSIFGELITLLEEDRRFGQPNELRVQLPYSKRMFTLPPNLKIIGTMNTADRSIALIDMALRRRFVFTEMLPQPELLNEMVTDVDLPRMLTAINDRLEVLYDKDHTIGHAYFWNCATSHDVADVLSIKVIPLLQEYFYDDLKQVAMILNDHRKAPLHRIIIEEQLNEQTLFGEDLDGIVDKVRYRVADSFTLDAIVGIYS